MHPFSEVLCLLPTSFHPTAACFELLFISNLFPPRESQLTTECLEGYHQVPVELEMLEVEIAVLNNVCTMYECTCVCIRMCVYVFYVYVCMYFLMTDSVMAFFK